MTQTETPASPIVAVDRFRRFYSLEWRLIAPIPLAVVCVMVLIWVFLPRVVATNATSEAIREGQKIAAQFKVLRAYYTENVVNKIVKEGHLKPSFNHKSDQNAIPLPATFILDLSELLAHDETTINLYSKFPFPNR